MQTQTSTPSFTVPADMMQGILSAVGSLPWNQANGLMAPLVNLVQQQQAEYDKAQASAANQAGAPAA